MDLFEVTNNDKKIYDEELKDFLPKKMIDIHSHVWLKEFRKTEENNRTVLWPSLVAKDNSIEDIKETYKLMFPDKEVTPVIFSSASKRKGLELGNNYIADCIKNNNVYGLYYSHPEETADELEVKIKKGKFLGIKSYLNLSPAYLPEKEIRIFDFFPKHQLQLLNRLGAIMMLHIPRDGRLKDPVNLEQILEIKKEYPKIRLIIAHIGRAYCKNDVGNAFEVLKKYPDLMFDFCANTSEYAMTKLLEAFGPKHTMFGSDLPITRMRMRRIEENNTYINLVPPNMYGDSNQDPHLREVSEDEGKKLTFFMYEEIKAFKKASEKLMLTKKDIEDVFYNNAKKLIDGAYKDIYETKE